MKKLIIARHVACHGSKISDEGENQLDWLYKRLYNHVFDSSLAILCSPAPRARATVMPLEKRFLTAAGHHMELWSDGDHATDLAKVLELVQKNADQADVVILITHLEYAREFPAYVCKHVLDMHVDEQELGKGEAAVIDLEERTVTYEAG